METVEVLIEVLWIYTSGLNQWRKENETINYHIGISFAIRL